MVNLFQARQKYERQRNSKLLKSIVDWTVALYLVVPGAIIGYFLYKDFANTVENLWVTHVPLIIWIILLLFVTRMPPIRSYLQHADRLFLIQNQKQLILLKQAGFLWTFAKHLGKIIVCVALLSPIFFKVHHLVLLDLLMILLYLFTASFCNTFVKLRIQSKWLQFSISFVAWLVTILLFLYVPTFMSILICLILIIVCINYYQRHYVLNMKHFEQLVELDQVECYKWQSIIFNNAPELRSQYAPKIKKPQLLWKNSQRMFRKSDYFIEELICKTMLRNAQYKWGYLRFVFTGIGLILVVPGWAKFILLAILFFTLRTLMRSIIHQTFEHKIWSVFQVSLDQRQRAITRLIKGFVDVPILLIFFMLIIYMVLSFL